MDLSDYMQRPHQYGLDDALMVVDMINTKDPARWTDAERAASYLAWAYRSKVGD